MKKTSKLLEKDAKISNLTASMNDLKSDLTFLTEHVAEEGNDEHDENAKFLDESSMRANTIMKNQDRKSKASKVDMKNRDDDVRREMRSTLSMFEKKGEESRMKLEKIMKQLED